MRFDSLVLLTDDDRPWAAFGACRGTPNPDIFFATTAADEREAMRICNGCPVKDACLDWALDTRERYGIWGGATERQRRRMLRRSA